MSLQTPLALPPTDAQTLFDAGHIILLPDVPEQSTVGIDGLLWTTARFTGFKFVPDGLRMIIWAGPETFLRRACFVHAPPSAHAPRTIIRLGIDRPTEDLLLLDPNASLSADHLRTLDPQLAPYDFRSLARWRSLISHLAEPQLTRLLPSRTTTSVADGPEDGLHFTAFDLKRSWPAQATGHRRTFHARDTSFLLAQTFLASDRANGWNDLLAELELAFVLATLLHNPTSILAHERLIVLLARAHQLFSPPSLSPDSDDHLETDPDQDMHSPLRDLPALEKVKDLRWFQLVNLLAAQFAFLREDFFTEDLPGQEAVLHQALFDLRAALLSRHPLIPITSKLQTAWAALVQATDRFGWSVPPLDLASVLHGSAAAGADGSDDERMEEALEDRPVVVELDAEVQAQLALVP